MPGSPRLIPGLYEPSGDEPVEDIYRKFVGVVAKVYEADLPISFRGLFAGEARRRISLPGCPFQRRHHGFKALEQQIALALSRRGLSPRKAHLLKFES